MLLSEPEQHAEVADLLVEGAARVDVIELLGDVRLEDERLVLREGRRDGLTRLHDLADDAVELWTRLFEEGLRLRRGPDRAGLLQDRELLL
ncbi:hypothetical protein WMF11_24925 [Sorangium sp. So ce295]|uniref:hypothetical protein n=1 Tax=Sorangium sp. So ce295 TaxID=3133295 RepID=UPI003F644840